MSHLVLPLRFVSAGLLAALAACGSGSQAQPAGGSLYPAGVVPFKDGASAAKAGVYPGNARNCCFLGRRASLMLQVPDGTTTAVLNFYVPKVAPYAGGGESLTVTAEGKSVTATGASNPTHIAVSLPLSGGPRALPITIVASKSFVPSKIGLNNDTRDLSVMLMKVTYR